MVHVYARSFKTTTNKFVGFFPLDFLINIRSWHSSKVLNSCLFFNSSKVNKRYDWVPFKDICIDLIKVRTSGIDRNLEGDMKLDITRLQSVSIR